MTDPDDSDATLLERIAIDRDESALEQLLMRHVPTVKAILSAKFVDSLGELSIDEALQISALKLWEKAGKIKAKTVHGWLLKVATNAALDVLDGRSKSPDCVDDYDFVDHRRADEIDEPASEETLWLMDQLLKFTNDISGLQRMVMDADIDAGGLADSDVLATTHSTTRNSIQVTRSKVRKKFRERIAKLESQLTAGGGEA